MPSGSCSGSLAPPFLLCSTILLPPLLLVPSPPLLPPPPFLSLPLSLPSHSPSPSSLSLLCVPLLPVDNATGSVYILLEARLEALYKEEEEYEVLERFTGKTLFGKKYTPLFDYFQHVSRRPPL